MDLYGDIPDPSDDNEHISTSDLPPIIISSSITSTSPTIPQQMTSKIKESEELVSEVKTDAVLPVGMPSLQFIPPALRSRSLNVGSRFGMELI